MSLSSNNVKQISDYNVYISTYMYLGFSSTNALVLRLKNLFIKELISHRSREQF